MINDDGDIIRGLGFVSIYSAWVEEDVDELIATGNFRPILDWLSERVYGYGRMIQPKELILHIAGQPLDAQPWIDYATKKFTEIYNLQ